MHQRHLRLISATVGVLAVALSGFVTSTATVPVRANAAAITRSSWSLGTGIRLTRIRYPDAPNEVRILTITPSRTSRKRPSGPRIDVKAAGGSYPMYRPPSAIGWSGGAAAAVNGDFAVSGGRTAHASMIDGELWTTGVQQGSGFAFSADGSRAYVGWPDVQIQAARFGTNGFRVAGWNEQRPMGNLIQGYTSRGGRTIPPPGAASPSPDDPFYCAVRLTPSGPLEWAGAGQGALARTYTVDAQPQPCEKTPVGVGVVGNVVLATRADGTLAPRIVDLDKGHDVRITWSIAGWPGALDLIGGQPVLLRNGENVAPEWYSGANYFLNYNPRTAVGVNAGCEDADRDTVCKIFVLTVDGRQATKGWSMGMRLPNLAGELKRAGAVDAVNLDGGGGTEMWVRKRQAAYCESPTPVGGCLVSRPSQERERSTVVSLTVLPGSDPGEPKRLR
jgi:hypothetical protein